MVSRTSSTTVRLIFPHQLFTSHLKADKSTTIVLVEHDLFFRQYSFHKQKLLLHRASMRYFYDQLSSRGFETHYIESSAHVPSDENLINLFKKLHVCTVEYYDVVDDWLEQSIERITSSLDVSIKRFNSPGFLTTRGQIDDYFEHSPNRMQTFYEWQRKRLHILMDGSKPRGGKWSYDTENRKKLPKSISLPSPYPDRHSPYIDEAREWVHKHFSKNVGSVEPFGYPVTHTDSRVWLKKFLEERLENFGPYEDAIDTNESQLFHSALSGLINIGLLTPQEVLDSVVKNASDHDIPLPSLEGFVRQIIGWREYMRATYVRYGRQMRTSNYLGFKRDLASGWWDGNTGIMPIDTIIKRVLHTGYAHHIERLMILGSSMVLLRIHPDRVYEWFMSMFIDAYDWVMVPNVYAMSQFAAGDLITTKPYISGSNYILKMSNYKKAEWSDIWDALYWQFIDDYREVIEKNYRSRMVVKLYDRLSNDKKSSLHTLAAKWLRK